VSNGVPKVGLAPWEEQYWAEKKQEDRMKERTNHTRTQWRSRGRVVCVRDSAAVQVIKVASSGHELRLYSFEQTIAVDEN
jgi:hypothetical protein